MSKTQNTRRSRQCRGGRARNYKRAIGRATAEPTRPSADQVNTILESAKVTGALDSFNRQRPNR
jgi:hypothetical protein